MEVSKITSASVEHRSHSIQLKLITKSGQSSLNTIVKTSNSLGHGISFIVCIDNTKHNRITSRMDLQLQSLKQKLKERYDPSRIV